MSNERLKEIKNKNPNRKDMKWLIQQAEEKIQLEERVEELEKEVKHWKSCTDSEQKIAGRLQNKVNSLEKQNNELTGIGGMWMSARNKLEESQKLNQRYKQALEFYADEENHVDPFLYTQDNGVPVHDESEVDKDGGEKARQALKGDTDD